jgi:hypothetical protein
MHEKESRSQLYQIKIMGVLDKRWAEWFDGMSIAYGPEEDGAFVTTLTGPVADQAALHGLLTRIRDLNLRLVSVVGINSKEEGMSNG